MYIYIFFFIYTHTYICSVFIASLIIRDNRNNMLLFPGRIDRYLYGSSLLLKCLRVIIYTNNLIYIIICIVIQLNQTNRIDIFFMYIYMP